MPTTTDTTRVDALTGVQRPSIAALVALLLLAGCAPDDPNACTKESADAAGAYYSQCMQGDGSYRYSYSTCGSGAFNLCQLVKKP